MDRLPGANCGSCGYAGCAAFAHELTSNPDAVMACPAVSAEALKAISQLLGKELGEVSPLIACVRCKGGLNETASRYEYVGPRTVVRHRSAGGPKGCEYGCLVRTASPCPFDAEMAKTDFPCNAEKCTGCGSVTACPRGIIALILRSANFSVSCISKDAPKEMKKNCSVGCIMRDLQRCPPLDAISVSKDKAADQSDR